MVFDFNPRDILFRGDLYQLESDLADLAIEAALLGAIDQARELASILLRSHPVSPGNIKQTLNQLGFAWRYASGGNWPDGMAPSEGTLTELREAYDAAWGPVPNDCREYNRAGLEQCLAKTGTRPDEVLVKALDISLLINHVPGPPDSATASMTMADLDEQSADLIRRIIVAWPTSWGLPSLLATAERLWPFFASGLMADALALERIDVTRKAGRLVAAAHERLRVAYVPSLMGTRSIKELLQIGEYNTISPSGPGGTFAAEHGSDLVPKTLYRGAASLDAIAAAESRLKIQLPADYKDFLEISNGLGEGSGGAETGIAAGVKLHNIEEVRWHEPDMIDVRIDLIEMGRLVYEITEEKSYVDEYGSYDLTDPEDFPHLYRLLEIGKQDVKSVHLIPPEDMERIRNEYIRLYGLAPEHLRQGMKRAIESFAGSMQQFQDLEWGVLVTDDDGLVYGYKSFKAWLEEEVWNSFTGW